MQTNQKIFSQNYEFENVVKSRISPNEPLLPNLFKTWDQQMVYDKYNSIVQKKRREFYASPKQLQAMPRDGKNFL